MTSAPLATPFIFTPRQTSKFFDRLDALGYETTETPAGTHCVGAREFTVFVATGRVSLAMTAEEASRGPGRVVFKPERLLGKQSIVER